MQLFACLYFVISSLLYKSMQFDIELNSFYEAKQSKRL